MMQQTPRKKDTMTSALALSTAKTPHDDPVGPSDVNRVIKTYALCHTEAPFLRDAFAKFTTGPAIRGVASLDNFLRWLQHHKVEVTADNGQLRIQADRAKAAELVRNYRRRNGFLLPMQAVTIGLLAVFTTVYFKDVMASRLPPMNVRACLMGTLITCPLLNALSGMVQSQGEHAEAQLCGATFDSFLRHARMHHPV